MQNPQCDRLSVQIVKITGRPSCSGTAYDTANIASNSSKKSKSSDTNTDLHTRSLFANEYYTVFTRPLSQCAFRSSILSWEDSSILTANATVMNTIILACCFVIDEISKPFNALSICIWEYKIFIIIAASPTHLGTFLQLGKQRLKHKLKYGYR